MHDFRMSFAVISYVKQQELHIIRHRRTIKRWWKVSILRDKYSKKSSHSSLTEEYPFLREEKILGRFKQNNPRHHARLPSSTRVEKVDNTAGSRAQLR